MRQGPISKPFAVEAGVVGEPAPELCGVFLPQLLPCDFDWLRARLLLTTGIADVWISSCD